MDMVLMIWISFPINILEMILVLLPLSMIFSLNMVCKGWSQKLSNNYFISKWKHRQNKEYGFLVNFRPCFRQRFNACYINQLENCSSLSMSLLNNNYKIESPCGSIVSVPLASNLYPKRNYYIINPFTKTCTFIGSLDLGDWGFFASLRNSQQQKYHWEALKHVYAECYS